MDLTSILSPKTILSFVDKYLYVDLITWGIIGSLVGALIYGLADDMPTNGMVVLWSIVASLVCYFIVRAVNNKNSANKQRTKV